MIPRIGRGILIGLWAGLVVVVGLLLVERTVAATTWHPVSEASVTVDRYYAAIGNQVLEGGVGPTWLERRWHGIEGSSELELELTYRLVGDDSKNAWFAYDPGFRFDAVEGRKGVTLVHTPPGYGSFITRRIRTDAVVAGRTFRLGIEMRAKEEFRFSSSSCQGIVLREVGGNGEVGCFDQVIPTDWLRQTFTWTVPESATSNVIRVELRVPAEWYEVGTTILEEFDEGVWRALGPLEPTGLRVAFVDSQVPSYAWSGVNLEPKPEWVTAKIPVHPSAVSENGTLWVRLRPEPGTLVEVSKTTLKRAGQLEGQPVALPRRGSLWFGHPNLAAHSVVAAAIVLAVRWTNPLKVVAAAAVGALGVMLTGSRTAFLALLTTLLLLLVVQSFRRVSKGGLRAAFVVVIIGMLAISFGPLATRVQVFGAGNSNQVSRSEIWAFALRAMLEVPLGTDRSSFSERWQAAHEEDSRPYPSHAHNLWLQYGALYGFPGLFIALALSVGLYIFVRRRRGLYAAIGLVGILMLQVGDYTLFALHVLLFLLILVNGTNEQTQELPSDGNS